MDLNMAASTHIDDDGVGQMDMVDAMMAMEAVTLVMRDMAPVMRATKPREWSDKAKLTVYGMLLEWTTPGLLKHVVTKELARLTGMPQRSVHDVWRKEKIYGGMLGVLNRKPNNCGRKRFAIDSQSIKAIYKRKRRTIKDLANELNVSAPTVWRRLQEKQIRRHINAIKESLTDLNKRCSIEDTVRKVCQAFEQYPAERSNRIFLALQSCIHELLKDKGGQRYKIRGCSNFDRKLFRLYPGESEIILSGASSSCWKKKREVQASKSKAVPPKKKSKVSATTSTFQGESPSASVSDQARENTRNLGNSYVTPELENLDMAASTASGRVENNQEIQVDLSQLEENLKSAESKVSDLTKALELGQLARAEFEEKLRLSLEQMVKIKAGFVVFVGNKEPVKLIKDVLAFLSTIPRQIGELKRSATRAGATYSLSCALAYSFELDPAEVSKGFLELKADGSPFDEDDYRPSVLVARKLASHLVSAMCLKSYHPAYDSNNAKIQPPQFKSVSPTPQCHKQLFSPHVDPLLVFHEEAMFEALANSNWNLDDLQIREIASQAEDQSKMSPTKAHDKA
ncbi:transposon mariner sub-class [Hordeum vulgare]|nr:transposon mariner sub-class [Hordeum vulgare]